METLVKEFEIDGNKYYVYGIADDDTSEEYDFFDVYDIDGTCLNEGAPFFKLPTEKAIKKLVEKMNERKNVKLKIQVFEVSLYRKDGELVESTKLDERNDEFGFDFFYTDLEVSKQEGDYLKWDAQTEIITEEEYVEMELKNKIFERIKEE